MATGHPIGYCSVHGFFKSQLQIGASSGGFIVFGENNVTSCPTCGASAEILPGEYSEGVDGQLNFLADTELSTEGLKKLREIAERARRNEITADEAKAEAAAVSPKAGRLFDVADWPPAEKVKLYAAIIAGAALILSKCTGSDAPISNIKITNQPVIERVVPLPPVLPGLPGGDPLKPRKT